LVFWGCLESSTCILYQSYASLSFRINTLPFCSNNLPNPIFDDITSAVSSAGVLLDKSLSIFWVLTLSRFFDSFDLSRLVIFAIRLACILGDSQSSRSSGSFCFNERITLAAALPGPLESLYNVRLRCLVSDLTIPNSKNS